MVAALFDMPSSSEFPDDWPYHGSSSGYRYGCRCQECRAKHRESREKSAAKARAGRYRVCARCQQNYDRHADADAGTKYCGDCKRANIAYYVHKAPRAKNPDICIACGGTFEQLSKRWAVCESCRAILEPSVWEQLQRHHASPEFMLAVMSDQTCGICGVELVGTTKDAKGKYRSAINMDHDHACCQRQVSCGKCLRGILCAACNRGLGFFGDDPERLNRAAAYLRRVN